MDATITSSTASTSSATPIRSHHQAERRDEMKSLVKDVKSGDLQGAQTAYAALTKNIPASVLSNPNSALGQLGTALKSGDMTAVKAALDKVEVKMHDIKQAQSGGVSAAPVRAPVTSSSGGTAGALLNEVA